MISLYEGDAVSYVGAAMPPAHGKLLFFASEQAAHVKWSDGPFEGKIAIVDIWDLMPVESAQVLASLDPNSPNALRRVMASQGESGAVNFLVSANQVEGWTGIARETLNFVQAKLRSDASMDMAYEQLSAAEIDSLIAFSSRVLLKDAFGELNEAD
jgi:hypothetical protein